MTQHKSRSTREARDSCTDIACNINMLSVVVGARKGESSPCLLPVAHSALVAGLVSEPCPLAAPFSGEMMRWSSTETAFPITRG